MKVTGLEISPSYVEKIVDIPKKDRNPLELPRVNHTKEIEHLKITIQQTFAIYRVMRLY